MAALWDEYSEQVYIQICKSATAVDLKTGETIILQFIQRLWLCDWMERSLIKPNQFRDYGISLCDDPTDRNRELGMELEDDYFLLMEMVGSTCSIFSRAPTNDELDA